MIKSSLTGLMCLSAACVGLLSATALAQHHEMEPAAAPTAAVGERQGDPYTLDTCPITGKALDGMGDPVVKVYGGREVRFCCGGCPKKFEADLDASWKKVDEQIIKRQMLFYPLDTCMVSGEKMDGEMGDPINFVHNNRLIRLCCKGCKRDFLKDSTVFLKKLDEAVIAKQRKHYPLQTCPVSGATLGSMGEPIEKVYGNRLVRFCCKGCINKFEKGPTNYVNAIDKAWKEYRGAETANYKQDSDHETGSRD